MCTFSCLPICVTPWTTACQAALPMGFCRPECWSGLQFPPQGDLPHSRIEPKTPVSSALAGGPLSHFERLLKDLCCAVLSHSVVSDSWETLWTVAHQGLINCRWIIYQLSYLGSLRGLSPCKTKNIAHHPVLEGPCLSHCSHWPAVYPERIKDKEQVEALCALAKQAH